MSDVIEVMARAIEKVRVFSRTNPTDGNPLPIEICRYGKDDEIEILERFSGYIGERAALFYVVRRERARAALSALTAAGYAVVPARDALMGAVASLAAISLLEGGGKQAAASDKIFSIMLEDYRKALREIRAMIAAREDGK